MGLATRGVDRIAAPPTVGHRRLQEVATTRLEHPHVNTVYAVQSLPVLDMKGAVIGWVRADLLADGTKPSDIVILRDGSACGQADAAERVARDPSLLYPTRDEAVREGLANLRAADAIDRRRADPK
jgi:hypothetical protein